MRDEGFTQAEAEAWSDDLKRHRRPLFLPPTQDMHVALSFNCGVSDRGMVLQFTTSDGLTEAILLNPCVAAQLRKDIADVGRTGRWLDQNDSITFPTPQPPIRRDPRSNH